MVKLHKSSLAISLKQSLRRSQLYLSHFMSVLTDGSQAIKTWSDKEMVLVQTERNGNNYALMRSETRELPSCRNQRIIRFFLCNFVYILCLHFCSSHSNLHIYFLYTLLNEGSYVLVWGDLTSFDWSRNPLFILLFFITGKQR